MTKNGRNYVSYEAGCRRCETVLKNVLKLDTVFCRKSSTSQKCQHTHSENKMLGYEDGRQIVTALRFQSLLLDWNWLQLGGGAL